MNISLMALRVVFVITLVLGIVFWTGNDSQGLKLVHMLLGILFVALLWVIGTIAAVRLGNIGLQVSTFVVGLIIAIVGLTQGSILASPSQPHVIVQIIHLLLALLGIGLAEMASARVRRKAATRAA